MAFPSIGDILMLSQLSWKIGRAFTSGRKGAPSEFLEVEAEVNGLAKALKLLAETLFADSDDSILRQADKETQDGVGTIVNSCSRTITDLDSLMDQYQVIKKHRTVGGFAIERSWSDLVLAQYKTMMWTTEGGNIQNLRNMLQMHTSTITLTMQALQSKSLSRIESIVSPMAEQIDSIHQRTGSVGNQLDEVYRIVKDIAGRTPQLQASQVFGSQPSSSFRLNQLQSNGYGHDKFSAQDFLPPRRSSKNPSTHSSPLQQGTTPSRSPEPSRSPRSGFIAGPSSPPRCTTPSKKRVSEFSFGGSTARYSGGSYTSSDDEISRWSSSVTSHNSNVKRQPSTRKSTPLPFTPELKEPESRPDSQVLSSMLPPPAMAVQQEDRIEPVMSISSLRLNPPSENPDLHRSATVPSQQAMFEKHAFRNSAILCDVRGTVVQYTRQMALEESPQLVEACEDCRIAVVRKRETESTGSDVRMMTSIWVFSDDNNIRMELKMNEDEVYVPYSSYFSPEKVSVTVPCELKFHSLKYGQRLDGTATTDWINYVFESVNAAVLFQNELMGRTLLGTFRTEKTMRIHEGFSSPFTYAEQMCGMENLRVWEDNDTAAVIALIHFSARFRSGYLAFYLNSSLNPIRIKDEGAREVKVKGLRVPLEKGAVALRKDSAHGRADRSSVRDRDGGVDKRKVIGGAKIEFATEGEKRDFIDLVKDVQRNLMELPDLLGVN